VSDNEKPIDKAVELLVYAPIGLAMFAKDTVPTFLKMFVARGHTEVDQRRKSAGTQAGNYKTIGRMAVKYGGPEVKRQAGAAAETVRRRAEETLAGIAAATAPPPTGPSSTSQSTAATSRGPDSAPARPPVRPAPPAPPGQAPRPAANGTAVTADGAAELPIPDYDLLSATQVIERLEGLARPELLAIKAYESAHRARTTILGKIAQLAP
jgi:hypothetical protein